MSPSAASIGEGVYAAGRLDADSEGLLLLSDDGARIAQISSPKFKWPKTYLVQVEGVPEEAQMAQLHARDGYHCRYCGIPVIRPEVRKKVCQLYPKEVTWGSTNASQHAGFQALWAQYDHVLPHAYGGTNDLDNLVVSCAACNFGKMSYRLEELGLSDPRERQPVQSQWDGLERLLAG